MSCVHFPIFKNVEPVTTRYQLEGYIKCPDPGDTFAFKEQTLLLFLARDYGETVETVSDFIFLGSKITTDGDCSHEIKRHLLLGRKVMTNLGSILKSRDITSPTKVLLVKAMVFPVVIYGCESWTVKKAEH